MPTIKEKFTSQVESCLEEMRGALVNHGGNIELVDADPESGIVKVRLHGACVGCPMAELTVKGGIETELRERIPEVKEVVAVA